MRRFSGCQDRQAHFGGAGSRLHTAKSRRQSLKNAAAYESVLTKAFKEAEETDDDNEVKEEGSGEMTSSSCSSSGCGSTALQSEPRKDNQGHKIDNPAIDQKYTRSAINAEIGGGFVNAAGVLGLCALSCS